MLPLIFIVLGLLSSAHGAFGPTAAVRGSSSQPLQLWEHHLASATRYLPDSERLVAYKALKLAYRVHDGQKRRDGTPFVTHPVAVARLVASWGMDSNSIVAALLHDAVEDTPLTFGEVESTFGKEVRTLVQGVTRVSKIDEAKIAELSGLEARLLAVDGEHDSLGLGLDDGFEEGEAAAALHCGVDEAAPQAAAVELTQHQHQHQPLPGSQSDDVGDVLRLLHSCAGDWRVAVLKIADRLHNMRTLGAMPVAKQVRKSKETMELFVPLARAVGVHQLEEELQRLSSTHLHLFPGAAEILDRFPITGDLLRHFAEKQCPSLLENFIQHDEQLSRHDVASRLGLHRERWAEHCARWAD